MARNGRWVSGCPIREVSKAKFLLPIVPDQTARLTLKLTEENDGIQTRPAFR